jgi:serine/threonine protein kinase
LQDKSEYAGDQAGSLASGTQLGPYRVDAYIGAGGMGEVFRATDTRLRRCVAVKLLPLKRAVDPLSQQRFLHEARAASALNHPTSYPSTTFQPTRAATSL